MSLWPALVEPSFVERLREIVRVRIEPLADEIDRRDVYPVEIMKALARDGYTALTLEPEFGGKGLPFNYAVALFEEASVASAAVGVSLITTMQAQTILRLFGSESLKREFLPKFRDGLLCSYSLTEARHGSDIRSLDTKAVRDGDAWVIDGEKSFITSGSAAELFVMLAQTPIGVSAFAVPGDLPGIERYEGDNSATFGLRNGPHVNVRLKGVRIPADYLIGAEGKGVRQAVTTLDYSRTLAAAISVGIARAAFEHSLQFTRRRIAFDRKVSEFQGIQWYFAEMLADIDSARILTYHAGAALDRHDDIDRYSSAAKLRASETATRVASQAIQVCGAYGTMERSALGRYFRDAKAYEIAGGSSEVLKNTIAKYISRAALLKDEHAPIPPS